MLADKLNLVKKNIEEACDTAGRSPQEVTLIAVSKTKPVEMLKEAYDAGARVFGENKVQEILDKYDQMPSDVQWHMIGHLQRNKVKYIIDKVSMVHSVDSVRLAEAIEKEAAKKDICMPVLIEVNVAGEESKFGLSVEEVLPFLEEISSYEHLQVKGLMTIAPFGSSVYLGLIPRRSSVVTSFKRVSVHPFGTSPNSLSTNSSGNSAAVTCNSTKSSFAICSSSASLLPLIAHIAARSGSCPVCFAAILARTGSKSINQLLKIAWAIDSRVWLI